MLQESTFVFVAPHPSGRSNKFYAGKVPSGRMGLKSVQHRRTKRHAHDRYPRYTQPLDSVAIALSCPVPCINGQAINDTERFTETMWEPTWSGLSMEGRLRMG